MIAFTALPLNYVGRLRQPRNALGHKRTTTVTFISKCSGYRQHGTMVFIAD